MAEASPDSIIVATPFVRMKDALRPSERLEVAAHMIVWVRQGVRPGESHLMLASGEQCHVVHPPASVKEAIRKAMKL